MERFLDWVFDIPPVTRAWIFGILSSSTLTTFELVSKNNLAFTPEKAFGSQWWRNITSFCYFGDLSINLLFDLSMMVAFNKVLESSFKTELSLLPSSAATLAPNQLQILSGIIEKNRSLDFCHYVLLICLSILTVATVFYYTIGIKVSYPGYQLCYILFLVWCRKNPQLEVSFFGLFTMFAVNLPMVYGLLILAIEEMKGRGTSNQDNGFFAFYMDRNRFLFLSTFYFLGHIWWFCRDFLLPKVYWQNNDEKTIARAHTKEVFNSGQNNNVFKSVISTVLLPPWYWGIISRLRSVSDENF